MQLIAEGVGATYPGLARFVLRGVSLNVASGERVAITGPSGSGKTTLLAVLGGMLAPIEGTVLVGPAAAPIRVTDAAWVLQTANVLPDRTVLDNAVLGGLATGLRRSEAVVVACHALERVGLGDRARSPVRDLSGGEVQRVVIARALSSQRQVLLADEPTGQLDARTTQVVLDALFDQRHGRTVVVATHDEAVARRCDRVLALVGGRLRARRTRRPREPRGSR